MTSSQIIVGIDGSSAAAAATRWASAEAARRGVELVVVHVYDWRVPGGRAPVAGAYAEDARTYAQSLVDAAIIDAQAYCPEVRVRGETLLGATVPTLVQVSAQADLVVLGSRGRGGFASLLLGSVSQQVATHAASPVVVVRGRSGAVDGPVVVGVDGSDAARHAVGLAFEEAAARRTGVVAIRSYMPAPASWSPYTVLPTDDLTQRRTEELALLAADVRPWMDKYPDVAVETSIVDRPPADVLIDLSAKAQLVVVGTRGHGGFAGLLLGSVGLHLLHHAGCPVLLTREPAHQSI